jgi:hypothetical protein
MSGKKKILELDNLTPSPSSHRNTMSITQSLYSLQTTLKYDSL